MIRTSDRRVTPLDYTVARELARIMVRIPMGVRVSDPDLCLHCRQHQCVAVCPSGSLRSREDGRVSLDAATCCGCTACIQVCREFTNLAVVATPGAD
jgi:Fe-S-cluster-containing dehydrogenase component